MSKNSEEVVKSVDLEQVLSVVEEKMLSKTTSTGKYLSWSYIRKDVEKVFEFLFTKKSKISTSEVRIFLIEFFTQKINNLPDGNTFVNEKVGTIMIRSTLTEYKNRKIEQLNMSSKSSNNGPTFTRMLLNNRKELERIGIKYENGEWYKTG